MFSVRMGSEARATRLRRQPSQIISPHAQERDGDPSPRLAEVCADQPAKTGSAAKGRHLRISAVTRSSARSRSAPVRWPRPDSTVLR